jgi:hypothetical protein
LTRKILLTGAALIAASFGAARQDAWEVIGPGGGGAQFFPAFNPQNPNDIFEACDMTGAYVSHDGGSSWRLFNLGAVVKGFVFDPNDARTVYARTAGEHSEGRGGALWRSTNAGDTWQLVYPDPAAVTGVFENSDHATSFIASSADDPGEIEALAVDPADSRVLYAAMRRNRASRLFVSADGGKTWKASADLGGGARSITIDASSPRGERTIYVIGENSVAVRKAGAWQLGAVPNGVTSFVDAALGFSDGKAVIYGVTKTGAFVSEDGGVSWRESRLPGESPEFHAIAASGRHGEVAYLSYSNLSVDGEHFFGVAKSANAGRTWALVWQETSKRAASNIHDIWIT